MASYGEDGQRAQFCPRHKRPGLVDVINRTCAFEGCRKRPHYNFPGERGHWCSTHKLQGMVNVTGVNCEAEGCTKRASYGYEGQKRSRCAQHKLPRMVDVAHRYVKKTLSVHSAEPPETAR